MRIIIRYGNRKYYDKSTSKYINLLDILLAVKNGHEILVRTKDGRDRTARTITDAIAKYVTIPVDMARDLVQELYLKEKENQNDFLPKENNYDRL